MVDHNETIKGAAELLRKEEVDGIYESLGRLAELAILCPVLTASLIFRGWVFTWLWEWFLTPAVGWEVPPVLVCTGLVLVFRFLTLVGGRSIEPTPEEKAREKSNWRCVWENLTASLVWLGMGYLLQWCIVLLA
jgi:hypothetical protein